MFLLESAALPGENDFCVPRPGPPSPRSVGVHGCAQAGGRKGWRHRPPFSALQVEKPQEFPRTALSFPYLGP